MSPELNLHLHSLFPTHFYFNFCLHMCAFFTIHTHDPFSVPPCYCLIIQVFFSTNEDENPDKGGVRIHVVLAFDGHSDHIVAEIL